MIRPTRCETYGASRQARARFAIAASTERALQLPSARDAYSWLIERPGYDKTCLADLVVTRALQCLPLLAFYVALRLIQGADIRSIGGANESSTSNEARVFLFYGSGVGRVFNEHS